MAQTDYVVRLLGKDDLSKVIANVKTNLKDTGKAAERLDDIQRKFKAIAESTAAPKRQLREIQKLLADMNLEGFNKTPLFTQMAERAGQLADAIGDARTAVNAYASDTFKLEAMAQGFGVITSAATIASSAMDLFGVENENVTKSIKKVQMALTLLNGIQQTANYLNKDSALMLRLKQVQLKGAAAYTATLASATTADTVATGANTVAVGIATKARARLNQAVAIGKALMGDWTGIVLIGATALAAYAVATNDSTEKLDSHKKAIDSVKDSQKSYNDSLAKTTGQLVGKYEELRISWARLKSVAEKTKWIADNADEFRNLGLKVTGVKSAEDIFVANTANVVKALEARAKALALQNQMTANYEKFYQDTIGRDKSVASGDYVKVYKGGQKISKQEAVEAGLKINRNSFSQSHVLTPDDADKYNKYLIDKAGEIRKANQEAAEKALETSNAILMEELKKVTAGYSNNKFVSIVPEKNSGVSSPASKKEGTPKVEKEAESFAPGSIKYARQMIAQLRDEEEKAADETSRLWARSRREEWEKELKRLEGKEEKVEVKPVITPGSLADLQSQLKDVSDKLHNISPDDAQGISSLTEEYRSLTEQIRELNMALGFEEGDDPLEKRREALEEYQEKIEETAGAVATMGGAFSELGGNMEGAGGKMLQFAGQSMQAGAKIAEQAAKLVAAKQAEATASGIAGATSSVPFPASLGAIASIVATITSLFASLPKFESGGIVGGTSTFGDRTLIRANAGEMILNREQQNNLYRAIANGRLGGGGRVVSGNVRFEISGDKLAGVLDNYNSKIRRQS